MGRNNEPVPNPREHPVNDAQPHRKERFWSKKAPEGRTWDVIVIGSGIGGMTTASALARQGKKVLVLEQHYVPGGYTHVFRRKGYEWDVGVHLVGAVDPYTLTGRVLKDLTNDQLHWKSLGDPYDTFWFPDDFEIAFPNSPAKFREALVAKFPAEEAVIDRYLAEQRRAARALQGFYLARALPGPLGRWFGGYAAKGAKEVLERTAAEVLEELVPNDKLRAVLLAQWGYQGSPPSEVSWGLQAIVSSHFLYGAWYPVGGASEIARTMLRTVAEAGGWTRICTDVDKILLENGRAVGVRLADGEEIRAPRIVSAAGAHTTVTRFLPPEVSRQAWAAKIATHKPGPAHLALYIGFKGDIASVGATTSAQWYYGSWDHEEAFWHVDPDTELSDPNCLFTSFPSLKDPHHDPGPEQRHTGEIVTFVPWEPFQRWSGTRWRNRGEDYEAFKQRMTDKMLAVLYSKHPGLEAMVDHVELATPLSTDLFAKPYKGSIYGLAHTPDRLTDPWLRAKSPVPGLYLSGSDVTTCGIMGAMMGGLVCAVAMEPVGTINWVRKLEKPAAPMAD